MLVDTDVLIWYLRGQARAGEALDAVSGLAISAVNYMELVQGCRNKDELVQIKREFAAREARIYPITESICARAVALLERHFLGNGLQMADALIAATCIEHGLTLLSANTKHFNPIDGLALQAFEP